MKPAFLWVLAFFLLATVELFLAARCSAGTTGLDTQFGTSGLTSIDFNLLDDKAHAVAADATGALYLVGYATMATQDFGIAKLTTAGALDTTFNGTGKTTVDFNGNADEAFALAVQTDGKAVVAGRTGSGSSAQLGLIRLNANGTLDTSFGTNGVVTQLFGDGQGDFRAAAIDGKGRILVAGTALVSGKQKFIVARFLSTGALDSTFASSGASTLTPGAVNDFARAVAVVNTNILVAGTKQVTSSAGTSGDFAILRLTDAGAIDTTFGTGGYTSFDFASLAAAAGARDDALYSMALTQGGFVVLSGSSLPVLGNIQLAVLRLTAAGTVDTGFGTSGATLITAKQNSNTVVTSFDATSTSILPQINGGLLLGGTASGAFSSSVALAKLNSAGTPNLFFGYQGVSLLTVGQKSLISDGSILLSNGKWIVVGSDYNGTQWNFATIRYIP